MKKILIYFFFVFICHVVHAQLPDTMRIVRDTVPPLPSEKLPVLSDTTQYNDTTIVKNRQVADTVVKKKVHSPRKATMRSLIIPGWGQVYNKKYWKVPIVYGAIGFPAYLFVYNRTWYQRTRYALSVVVNDRYDSASLAGVHKDLMALVNLHAQGSLVSYRNQFRRDMDYSILFTLLMWGLNVVDATVDAHLKGFDVSDELTLHVKPGILQGTMTPGISLVLNFK
jgi:hypothetical protein